MLYSFYKMMKISIIIPLYNASSYLHHSIDSILSQPFQDIEIILVDDGSTDESSAICDEYANRDKRIKVFHEPHSGVAHSRQVGLEHAIGEYILYVDADDLVDADMVSEMYDEAIRQQVDMVICDYRELTHEGEIYRMQEPSALDGVTVLDDILNGKLYGALWNKMMRREWLLSANACFPEVLTMREDLIFLSQCLPFAKKIAYIPKAYYGYERRNATALTSNYVNETPTYYNQESLWISLILKNAYLTKETCLRLEQYFFKLSYITLKQGLFERNLWNERFQKHKDLLTYGSGFRKAIVSLACHGHFHIAQILRTLISKVKS